MRSSSVGHRKGKDYSKISSKLGIDKMNLIDAYISILEKANDYLAYMLDITNS